MTRHDELRDLFDLLDSDPGDLRLALEALAAAGGEELDAELKARLSAGVGPHASGALDLAARDLERALDRAEDVAGDPFFADDASGHERVLDAVDARELLERATLGAASLDLPEPPRVAALTEFDDRLRELLDLALPANPLRRNAAPADSGGWWWVYRVDCDEELLGRASRGWLSAEERERLEDHLERCPFCAEDDHASAIAAKFLRRGSEARAPACPDAKALEALALGELPFEESQRLAAHVDLCASCREALRAEAEAEA